MWFISIFALLFPLVSGPIILFLLLKLLKIDEVSFRKSLIISTISWIPFIIFNPLYFFIKDISHFFSTNIFIRGFPLIITFIIFYICIKKYYQMSWWKMISIFLLFYYICGVISLIMLFLGGVDYRLFQ